jgi:nitronate monooxygenase
VTLPGELPIIQAPMAGGPSTPELTAAVSAVGGFGYVAAGYLSPDALDTLLARTRELTAAPFGVNIFVPSADRADAQAIAAYARVLAPVAQRLGVAPGVPLWDDDGYDAKLDVAVAAGVHTVSFTFGCPSAQTVGRLRHEGIEVAVTVTSADEARAATAAGADSLIVQGTEAGGHQGTFDGLVPNHTPLLDALRAIRAVTDRPLVAAGAIMTAADAGAALQAGAVAIQIGTALLCAAEAGTSAVHRQAVLTRRYPDTVITRAFSGRWARGLANGFANEHPDAPAGYPQINTMTKPLRAAATAAGDPDVPNLWAGTGWRAALDTDAAAIIAGITASL